MSKICQSCGFSCTGSVSRILWLSARLGACTSWLQNESRIREGLLRDYRAYKRDAGKLFGGSIIVDNRGDWRPHSGPRTNASIWSSAGERTALSNSTAVWSVWFYCRPTAFNFRRTPFCSEQTDLLKHHFYAVRQSIFPTSSPEILKTLISIVSCRERIPPASLFHGLLSCMRTWCVDNMADFQTKSMTSYLIICLLFLMMHNRCELWRSMTNIFKMQILISFPKWKCFIK